MSSAKFFLFFLLLIPLATAITVDLSPSYTANKQMTIAGSCTAADTPVILKIAEGNYTLWFDQSSTDSKKNYSFSYVPSAKGLYNISVGCSGQNLDNVFCVGMSTSCKKLMAAVTKTTNETKTTTKPTTTKPTTTKPTTTPTTTQTTPSGGGGRKRCDPKWSCSTWSLCNASLQQKRSCTDLNNCRKSTTETRSCTACVESWVCTQWDTCSIGYQDRKCYDEHKCGTYLQKPYVQKVCQAKDTGYSPARTTYTIPTPVTTPSYTLPPIKKTPKSFWKQMWDKYQIWIIAIPAAILLLIIALLLFLHFHKPKTEVENIDELKAWVKQELARGTPKEKLKALITHHTGWNEEELHEAFEELKHEHPQTTKPTPSAPKQPQPAPLAQQPAQPGSPPVQPTKTPAKQPAPPTN